MSKCAGLMGKIFGHKFIKNKGGWIHDSNFCLRCGAMAGQTEEPKKETE